MNQGNINIKVMSLGTAHSAAVLFDSFDDVINVQRNHCINRARQL